MAITTHVLVVANQTVDAPGLHAALAERAQRGTIHVTLLVPVAWSQRDEARSRVDAAVRALGEAGIAASGELGDADPMIAVQEAWNPGRYDEIFVSTLAEGASRWLRVDLPHRVAKLTDCSVQHVEVHEARMRVAMPPPPAPRRSILDTALSFLQTSPRSPR